MARLAIHSFRMTEWGCKRQGVADAFDKSAIPLDVLVKWYLLWSWKLRKWSVTQNYCHYQQLRLFVHKENEVSAKKCNRQSNWSSSLRDHSKKCGKFYSSYFELEIFPLYFFVTGFMVRIGMYKQLLNWDDFMFKNRRSLFLEWNSCCMWKCIDLI